MPPKSHDARVDAYIGNARPFARPILIHLRHLVHQACPEVTESIKWSRPFFDHRGKILANMSAFTAHCSFGFWGEEIAVHLAGSGLRHASGITSLDHLKTLADLPLDEHLLAWIAQAARFIDTGNYTGPLTARAAKPVPELPAELAAALKTNPEAAGHFAAFPPSCQREYIQWIAEAKLPQTRDKRLASAVTMIAMGKRRS